MKKAIVIVVILALLAAGCATNVRIVNYYPPGNAMYPSIGNLLIRVDASGAGRARGGLSGQAEGKVIEQIEDNIFFIEDSSVQTLEQYIQAAFSLDYGRSNAFEIVSEEKDADYILDVTVDRHLAITTTNILKLLLASVFMLPTFGLTMILVKIMDLEVENVMTVVLQDRSGAEVYATDFTERFTVSYSMMTAGYYNPSYIRIGQLKRIVAKSLAEITELL